MTTRTILLAGVAVLALAACGKKDAGSSAALKADAGSPIDAAFSYEGGAAIDVDQLLALLPEAARPTYASAAFDEKLGAMVVTGIAFPDQDGDGTAELTVERAELYGVDVASIDRVKSGAAGADAPLEKVFEKVRLFGLAPDMDESGTASLAAAEIDRLSIRQGGLPDNVGESSGVAHFLNAFDLGGLYFKDLSIAGVGDPEEGSDVSVKAPDMRIVGVGGGKLAAFIANDVEYEINQSEESRALLTQSMGPEAAVLLNGPLGAFIAPARQRVKMASLEWRGADASAWMSRALKGEKTGLTNKNALNLGELKAVDIETYINDKLAAKAAESTIVANGSYGLVPSDIRAVTKGASYDFTAYLPPEQEAAAEILKKHGLDKVTGESDFVWLWNGDKGDASFDASFETDGLADMAMSMEVGGVVASALESESDPNAYMQTATFKGFSLGVTDEKLLDAIFDLSGLQMNQPGEDLRAAAPAMIRLSGAQLAQFGPRFEAIVEAVANFVADGGAIEITANPEVPVSFGALTAAGQAGPAGVPDAINLQVTHTPPKN